MGLFESASYVASAHDWEQLPPDQGKEVAFVGRSNAGKSSAINTLANHKRLAFVSKTPGRTQLINFFALGHDLTLVDLPGYGYAKVPPAVKAHWTEFLAAYVSRREALMGLVIIMDARHPLKPLDIELLEWYRPTGKPVHVLLTKSDKLTLSEQAQTLKAVKASLTEKQYNATAQLFSALKRKGVDEAERAICRLFGVSAQEVSQNPIAQKKKGLGKGDNPSPHKKP